jgi:fatty-acyl-CoA synthase
MWNTQEHFELYVGIPAIGAVIHTVNIRLADDEIAYIVNHAQDRVMFVDESLVPVVERLAPTLPGIEQFVVVGGSDTGALPNAIQYEELVGRQPPGGYDYPSLDERAAAGLCYTSGTTGKPKGVLYSHRSTLLHALAALCSADGMAICARDRVLPIVPMFHANGWGMPYAAALSGADLILASRLVEADVVANLIESERVTLASAVPTIWMDLLRYADVHHPDLSSLRWVPCGGAAVPLSLMQALQQRHGVTLLQGWGMTEMSPLASTGWPPRGLSTEEEWEYRTLAGRILPLIEARIVTETGEEQPWDGTSSGELEVRGGTVASGYFGDEGAEKFDDGWLRTGDVVTLNPRGYLRITDRAKDMIKSGGEWISSAQLETELMTHPAVREAAVIAKPDDRWSERPLAFVVVAEDEQLTSEDLAEHLRGRVAKWWIPDEFLFVEEIPKTSVGKFDKKVLRARMGTGDVQYS